MKVSTKSRYGLAAMVDLAEHYGKGPVALRSVAARQQVSEHYLEQLMSSLRKAGVVHSIRGAQGGYVLARDPATISVGDIVRAGGQGQAGRGGFPARGGRSGSCSPGRLVHRRPAAKRRGRA